MTKPDIRWTYTPGIDAPVSANDVTKRATQAAQAALIDAFSPPVPPGPVVVPADEDMRKLAEQDRRAEHARRVSLLAWNLALDVLRHASWDYDRMGTFVLSNSNDYALLASTKRVAEWACEHYEMLEKVVQRVIADFGPHDPGHVGYETLLRRARKLVAATALRAAWIAATEGSEVCDSEVTK